MFFQGNKNREKSPAKFLELRSTGQRWLEELYTIIEEESFRDRVKAAQSRLHQDRLKILIVGEFSRGKSTLINALAGQPVLPSGVNPTTASINIVRGGSPAQATFYSEGGKEETLALPEVKINRFLKDKVTVKNEQVHSLREVHIQIPGRLEALQADIVDTPGVNDLDAAREEVTFQYLREADAVVLILDAQQPLSESERIFLKDKVFGSDINRILFVVNKVDEVLLGGTREDIEHIRKYVGKRLAQHLGLVSPEIHMVSSKPALRARFKGVEDSSPVAFEIFEKALVAFADRQATTDRVGVHWQRLRKLSEDSLDMMSVRFQATGLELKDAETRLSQLEREQEILSLRFHQLHSSIELMGQQFEKSVTRKTTRYVVEMRQQLESKLSELGQGEFDDEAISTFRQELSHHLRSLVEKIENDAEQESIRQSEELEAEYGDLLAPRHRAHMHSNYLRNEDRGLSFKTVSDSENTLSGEEGTASFLQDFVTGASLGFVGASLFGPIGIGAAVVGQVLLTKYKEQEKAKALQKRLQQQMLQEVKNQCEELQTRVSQVGQQLAEKHASNLKDWFGERIESRQQQINVERKSVQFSLQQSFEEKQRELENLRSKHETLKSLNREINQFGEVPEKSIS